MKQYGALLALGVAVICGIAAVVLTNQWLSSQARQNKTVVRDAVPVTRIVIAAQDLQIGTRLGKEYLKLAEWPKSSVPRGAFEDIAALEGRVAVTHLAAGKPVLAAELAAPGSGAGLVALIAEGYRAMAVQVNEVTGVGGFILPNTYVDIIGIDNQNRNNARAHTILKRLKVLAVAQETFTEEGKARVVRTVTLELKPEQAEELASQTHKGAIHLVLRNPLEEDKPEPVAVAKKTVRRTYRPRPQPFNVEVIRGTERESMKFRGSESENRLR